MHLRLTKQQLRELQTHRGELDDDSGRVFERPIGARDPRDGLYTLELHFSQPDEERTYEHFSLEAVLVDALVSEDPGDPPPSDSAQTPQSEINPPWRPST